MIEGETNVGMELNLTRSRIVNHAVNAIFKVMQACSRLYSWTV